MNQLILAYALISMPPQPDYEPTPADVFFISLYGNLIREAAVQNELLDSRERDYAIAPFYTPMTYDTLKGGWVLDLNQPLTVNWSVYFSLRAIRKRNAELGDAPFVADAQRFPAKETVDQWIAANRAYKAQLEWDDALTNRRNFYEFKEKLAVNEEYWRLLDTLRDVKRDYYYVWITRQRLKLLRDDLLGPDMYYRGQLPPPVPLEYFREIK